MANNSKRKTQNSKPILDEIASIRNDIIMDYIGNTALNPDKVLRTEGGGKGIELYEDLLRDSEVSSALQTRKLAVIGKEWEIIPASDSPEDVKIAEFVKGVFLGFGYDDARKALLSGIVLGYKPAEIMWEYSEGDVWIKDIISRASRRFVFDLEGNLRLLTLENMVEGEELPDRKFMVFRNVSDNGSYYGDGLGSKLYWPVWFRKNGIKFWAIFCDKFGSPTPVGKYPPGTPKEKQDDLLDAISAIQQDSGVVIPETMIVELLEATRAGSINTYETFCAYMDKGINKVLLGHSAATESTPGKLGNDQQAADIRQDYLKADADALCGCQNNSVIPWLVDYNFPGVKVYPKVWIRTEPEKDLKPLADRDLILARDIRLPMTKKYFYETYGIPQPEEGDELVEIPPPTPAIGGQLFSPSEGGQRMSPAGRGAGGGREYAEKIFTKEQQSLEGLIETAGSAAAQSLADNEMKIMEALESSQNYEEAREKLKGIDMDMKEFEILIERSALAGLVFGRYTMQQEEKRAKP